MKKDIVIEVKNLSKKFPKSLKRSLAYGTIDTIRNFLGFPSNQGILRKSEFWALDDINFELNTGEVLGIVGMNGSGKSTLLRVLNGIFPPDKGTVKIKGNVGGLIAVGAGFHPHMTGRENVYLNGTILGMSKREIDEKFQSIVDFAEIGDFLDSPVSTYSSGMKVRLGFGIAIHVEPEILLIDEVLAVGDLSFRNKSMRYMDKLKKKAKSIIFISHNLEQIRRLCTRVIVLDKGKVVFDGETTEGCIFYENLTRDQRVTSLKNDSSSNDQIEFNNGVSKISIKPADTIVHLKSSEVINSKGEKSDHIGLNEKLTLQYQFELEKEIPGLFFSIGLLNEELKPIIWLMSNDGNKFQTGKMDEGLYMLEVEIEKHHLSPGVYIPNISIRNTKTDETYDRTLTNLSFNVTSDGKTFERGYVNVDESWKIKKIN